MTPTKLIEAEVQAPDIVEVPEKARTVEITVRATLNNISEHDYVLHAQDADDTHFWHVLNENNREVVREHKARGGAKEKSAVHPTRTQTLAAGHSVHESKTLTLDAYKLKPGRTYTVRSESWGLVAEATFVAVSIPYIPPPKKKVAAKKTTTRTAKPKKAAKK